MRSRKIWSYTVLAMVGAVLIFIGAFVLVDENVKVFSGYCYGLGAAGLCLGIGNIVSTLIISGTENDEVLRRKAVEVSDERNMRIREKAGAKTNQIMVYAITAVIVILGLTGADMGMILLVSSFLLLELVMVISLTHHYSERM